MTTAANYSERVQQAIAAGQWDAAAKLIIRHAPELVQQSRQTVLRQWLDRMPVEFVNESGWLSFWLASVTLMESPLLARKIVSRAFVLFEQQEDLTGQLACWSVLVDSYMVKRAEIASIDPWLKKVEPLLGSLREIPAEIRNRATCATFMALIYRCPDHPALSRWEQEVRGIVLSDANPELRMYVGSHLILYYMWWLADSSKADLIVTALHPIAKNLNGAPLARISWHMIEAGYAWMVTGSGQSAEKCKAGLAVAEEHDVHILDMYILTHVVFSCLCARDYETAELYLDRMTEQLQMERYMDSAWYFFLLAWLQIARGQYDNATESASLAMQHAELSGRPFVEAIVSIEYATLLFRQGKKRQAVDRVTQVLQQATEIGSRSIAYLAEFAQAEFALLENDRKGCLDHMRTCINLSRSTGELGAVWFCPETLTEFYRVAIEEKIELKQARNLIRRAELTPSHKLTSMDDWPWPLKIYTLGRFSLVRHEKPIESGRKAPKKALELLKVLIAFGGREVSSEKIMDALWSDLDADAAYSAYKTTLHRLRKLLGPDILVQHDGRLTLDSQQCWVDVWAVERCANHIERLDDYALCTQGTLLIDKILGLYQGKLFAREPDTPWVLALRERLHRKTLQAIAATAGAMFDQGKVVDALNQYKQGIDIDPLAEEFYQGVMRASYRLERRAEGLAAYQRCRRILHGILGVVPSPETESLRDSLQAGKCGKVNPVS